MCLALILALVSLSGGAPTSGRGGPASEALAMTAVSVTPPPPRPLNDTHADGLAWAKSEGVVDAEACHRIGPRFTAGCLAFVEAELRTRDLQLAEGFSRP
jgi:hypothetical protein